MSRWGYFWKLVRRSFHGTLRTLEVGEAVVATGVHCLGYLFPAHKEVFAVAFLTLVGLLVLTFLVGLFVAAYASNQEIILDTAALVRELAVTTDDYRSKLLIGTQWDALRSQGLAILQASFGIGKQWADVTEAVRKRVCNGHLEMTPWREGNRLGELGFIDPAPGQLKQLVIVYSVKGSLGVVTAAPDVRIVLPPEP